MVYIGVYHMTKVIMRETACNRDTSWVDVLLGTKRHREARGAEMTLLAQNKLVKGAGGEGERLTDERRDRTVKYLWSIPKEMLWERRNQQNNQRWESGGIMFGVVSFVAGMGVCFSFELFFHVTIILPAYFYGYISCKQTLACVIYLSHKRERAMKYRRIYRSIWCYPSSSVPLKRSINNTWPLFKQSDTPFSSVIYHINWYTRFPQFPGVNNHTLKAVILLACSPVWP